MTKDTQDVLEGIYEKFQEHVDTSEWYEAKSMLKETIDRGNIPLSKEMNRYYNENVCQDCLGTGRVMEGEYDNIREKECICMNEFQTMIKYNKDDFITERQAETFKILAKQGHTNAYISNVLALPEEHIKQIAFRLGLRRVSGWSDQQYVRFLQTIQSRS